MQQTVEVISINNLTSRIKVLRLANSNGKKLAAFSPGSHITVEIPIGQKLHLNSYTLCSSPYSYDFYDIAVLLTNNSRGGSQYLHQLGVAAKLNISFPKNSFTLASFARKYILIAGGIGITPYLSIMAYLDRNNIPFELHYAAKSISECPFYDFLCREYSSQVKFYFSDRRERIQSKQILKEQPLGTHVYLCAPHGLSKEFRRAAKALGYPDLGIHQEIFGWTKVNKHKPFTVVLAQSNREITVDKDKTLLETLEAAKVSVNYACRIGGCGACELKVLAGKVKHLDNYYSLAEKADQNRILVCVSRAQDSQLVIDI